MHFKHFEATYLMGNAFQAMYGIRKVLREMHFKLNNDQLPQGNPLQTMH